jgi:hypothetical protein
MHNASTHRTNCSSCISGFHQEEKRIVGRITDDGTQSNGMACCRGDIEMSFLCMRVLSFISDLSQVHFSLAGYACSVGGQQPLSPTGTITYLKGAASALLLAAPNIGM